MTIAQLTPLPGEVSVLEYADLLGSTRGTIKRWIHEGMPVRRTGKRVFIFPEAASTWVKEHARSVAFHRTSLVYLVKQEDGAIKIGWTSDLERRLNEIRKENRTTTTLLAALPGTKVDELRLQGRFAKDRLEGEWFIPSADIVAFVDGLGGMI